MTIGAKKSRAAASAKRNEPVEKPEAKALDEAPIVPKPEALTESGKAILALAGILKEAQKREKRRYPR